MIVCQVMKNMIHLIKTDLIKTDKYMFSSYLNIKKDHNIRQVFTKFRLGIFNKNFGNHRTITICSHCKNESSNFTSHIMLM